MAPHGRVALAALALLVAALALPQAAAHAELLHSSPPQGTRLEAAPPRVSVTFTEPVESLGTTLHVLDARTNARVDLGDLAFDGDRLVSVGLPRDLADGAYRVNWTALSGADNHPTAGTFGFAVGDFDAPASGRDESVPVASAIARFVTYAGFALAFAAAAFLLWMRPLGVPAAPLRVALLVGTTLHLSGVVLQAANLASDAGVPVLQLAHTEAGLWRLLAVAVGAMAWLLAFVWTVRPVAAGPAVVTTLVLVSALASARLGHPYASGPTLMGVDFVHLVSAATWAGGLVLLVLAARRAERGEMDWDRMRQVGVRFGTIALVCVVVLAFTGLILSVTVLGTDALQHPLALMAAPYGLFLLGKVTLVALMVAIAAVNRYVLLAPPAQAGVAAGLQKATRRASGGLVEPGAAVGRLRRTVTVEASVGLVVLLLAGFLTSSPPPAEAAQATNLEVRGEGTYYTVNASMAPPIVGETAMVHLDIRPLDGGGPVVGNTCGRSAGESCVTLEVVYAGGPGAETHTAQPGGGIWMVDDVLWAQAGAATLRVHVSTQEHFEDVVELRVHVAPAA